MTIKLQLKTRPVYLTQRQLLYLLDNLRSTVTEAAKGVDLKGMVEQFREVLCDFKDKMVQYRELEATLKATAFFDSLEAEIAKDKVIAHAPAAEVGKLIEKKLKQSKAKIKKARKKWKAGKNGDVS